MTVIYTHKESENTKTTSLQESEKNHDDYLENILIRLSHVCLSYTGWLATVDTTLLYHLRLDTTLQYHVVLQIFSDNRNGKAIRQMENSVNDCSWTGITEMESPMSCFYFLRTVPMKASEWLAIFAAWPNLS